MRSNKLKKKKELNIINRLIFIMETLDWKLFIIILFALACATFLAYSKVDNEIIIAIIGLASNIVTWHITRTSKK